MAKELSTTAPVSESMVRGIARLGYDVQVVRIYDKYGWILRNFQHDNLYFYSQHAIDTPDRAVEEAFDFIFNLRR